MLGRTIKLRILHVQRAEVGAGALVSAFQVGGAEGSPGSRAEDLLLGHVVHVDRDAQAGSQADQVGADVAVAISAVVGAPGVHHGIDIPEGTFTGQARGEPGRRPGGIGALVEGAVDFLGQLDHETFGDLQGRAEAFDHVEADSWSRACRRG